MTDLNNVLYAGDPEERPSFVAGLSPEVHGGFEEDPHTHLVELYRQAGADRDQAEELATEFMTALRVLWEVPESYGC